MTYATTFRTLLTICSFFFAFTANAQTTLVSSDAIYQYYDIGDQPANDGADNPWYSPDYISTWNSFEGPLGYGAGDHNEVLNSTANTVYFRHQWNIESTTDFDLMFLNLLYNDGAIIYLNGNVINRVNMPIGEVAYNTPALLNVVDQQIRNIALPHLFVEGINTVAIEVHNSAGAGDVNLSFGLEIIEYHEVCEVVGQPCNDNNSNTINDTYNEDCECIGFECDIEAYAGETQEINEGQSATLEAQGGGSYFWSTGDTSSMIVVSPTSTTGYSVTVTDENGCADFADVMVDVIPCSAVAEAGEDITIEINTGAQLTSSEAVAYSWSTGEKTQTINVNPLTDQYFTVTITDENGCHAKDSVGVFIVPCFVDAPCDDGNAFTYDDVIDESCNCTGIPCDIEVNIAGNDSIIIGESVTLVASGGEFYTWNNGMNTAEITVSPASTTNYNVVVVDEHGCGDVASMMVHVLDIPCEVGSACDDDSDGTYDDKLNDNCECRGVPCHMDVEISGNDSISPGQTITLVAEGGFNYIWDHGAVGAVVKVSPEVTTTYTVTIIDTNGCEDIVSHTVAVADCVVGAACDDDSDGTYDDTLNDNCECIGFPCHMDIEIGGDDFISPGETVTIVAEGGFNYIWDHGAVGSVIQVSPEVTTTYTVTIIDTNGCEDIVSHTVTVADCVIGSSCDDDSDGTYNDTFNDNCECIGVPCHMDVEIEGEDLVSPGQTITIVAEGGFNYIWDHGAIGPVIQVSPEVTTTYTVTIIDTNGCEDIISHTVTVDDCMVGAPCDDGRINTYGDTIDEDCRCTGFECSMDIEITGNNIILPGESSTLVAEGGATYEWSNGMTGPVITVSPTETTNYTVVIVDANGCGDVGSFLVTVPGCTVGTYCDDFDDTTYGDQLNEECECIGFPCQMDVEIGGDTEIYEGQTATIVAEGGFDYRWNNGMRGPVVNLTPSTTSNYFVTITDTNGCIEEEMVTIVVLDCDVQAEVATFYPLFLGDEVTMSATGGASYEWSTGETTGEITVAPVESTIYTVTVFDNEYCFEVFDVFVEVIEDALSCNVGQSCDDFDPSTYGDALNEACDCQGFPCQMDVEVEGNTQIEIGQTATIVAEGGVSYTWSNGATGPSIEVSPATTTTYTVSITDSNGCEDEGEITVTVTECDVQASAQSFYSIIQGQTETLTAEGGAYYEWSTGETTPSIDVTPTVDTSYNVTVFDSEYCFEVLEIFVQVIADPACEFGSECDDNDPLTTNDTIDENCQCVGEGGVNNGEKGEAGVKIENPADVSTNEAIETKTEDQKESSSIPEEDCTPITSFFPQSKLKHYGDGEAISQYEFANLQSGVSFTISGISAKLAATEKSKYIDVVDVSFINESGHEVSYGTFSGESVNEVEVNISENIQRVIVRLVDGYDGLAPKINISLGNISSCSLNRQGATAQNSGLQSAQQELIELSLLSNLVNSRLLLNIDNPNSSSQPIYAVVFDVNGVAVIPDAISGEVLPGSQSEYIDISSLRPGFYYLKTKVGRQTITLEFVVAE